MPTDPIIAFIIIGGAFLLGLGGGLLLFLFRRQRWQAAEALGVQRLSDAEAALAREREERRAELANLGMTFKGLSSEVLKESREEFLRQAEPRIGEHVKPLADALHRYEEALRTIEGERQDAYGGLRSIIAALQEGHARLAHETTTLSQALRNPVTRGRWGEMTLRRVVEVAGMSDYCDFTEQETVSGAGGRLRPDMIVHLPGGRQVVVDSKTPIDAYADAMEATDEGARSTALAAHAQAVREHMRALGQKAYWSQFEQSPDFVVLFLPGESFFSAALEQDRALFEEGMRNRVVLATPTTLIVLLRSVAMGWQQQQGAENAQRIVEAGKELFERTSTFASHLSDVGTGIERAIKAFNRAVGSWDSRVVPGARRLKELGASKNPDADLPHIKAVESGPRQIASIGSDDEKTESA